VISHAWAAPSGRSPRRSGRHRIRPRALAAIGAVLLAAGCIGPFASNNPSLSPSPSLVSTASPSIGPTPSPLPTPEPPLSLALPKTRDARRLHVSVQPAVPATGTGHVTITVTSLAKTRVPELVLRWPTPLNQIVFLSPFQPSPSRLGDALVQPWTKWVIGPGEMGEPAGTTSLGWGPLDPGATLTIQLVATRHAAGPVAFDLQMLAGEALLTTDLGEPAETRVSIP
jgi:hypothetical protein